MRSSVRDVAVTTTLRIPGRTVSIRFLICEVLTVVRAEDLGSVTVGMTGPGTGVAGAAEGDVDTVGAGPAGICGAGTGLDATGGDDAFANATGKVGAGVEFAAAGVPVGGGAAGICGAGTGFDATGGDEVFTTAGGMVGAGTAAGRAGAVLTGAGE